MNRNDNKESNWNVKTKIVTEVNDSVCSLNSRMGKQRKKKISWEKIKVTRIYGTQTIHVSHTYIKYTQSIWCSIIKKYIETCDQI